MCGAVGGEGTEGEGGGGNEGFTDTRGVEEFVEDITRGKFEAVMNRSRRVYKLPLVSWSVGLMGLA